MLKMWIYKVDIIKETRDHKELEEFDISVPEVLEFDSDGVKVYGYFYKPYVR
jgi:dipeptidyl aminopeptidase/acylaminoacyl peptidase